MPRQYTERHADSDEREAIDWCAECWASLHKTGEDDHPDYDDCEYECDCCGTKLTADDN